MPFRILKELICPGHRRQLFSVVADRRQLCSECFGFFVRLGELLLKLC